MGNILEVKNLSAVVDSREILHQVSFQVQPHETVVLLGGNGAGKSTLAASLMGDPSFQVTGQIIFDGQDITNLPPDQRARIGLFQTFQSPIEIPGISTTEFLRTALEEGRGKPVKLDDLRPKIMQFCTELGLDIFSAERELNVGFSGGEKKKNEILQMLILSPKLTIFDEIDSGLDIDSARLASKVIADFQKTTGMSAIIITHNMRILEHLNIDKVIILDQGRIKLESDKSILETIKNQGFASL